MKIIPAERLPDVTSYAALRPYPMPLAFEIMLQTGLRVSELCSLSWCDLIYLNKPLTVLEVDKTISKSGRNRSIPINKRLTQTIDHAWKHLAYPKGFAPAHVVTATRPNGKGWQPRTVQRNMAIIGRHCGMLQLTPHMLRHTFATRLLKVSNLPTVQLALGHSRLETTRIYTHVNEDDLRDAVERLPQ